MGTNFYFTRGRKHIGKRSAAGFYCWDCRKTLCKDGDKGVHQHASGWHETCPVCGQKPTENPLGLIDVGSAAVELGWAKPNVKPKLGVASCSSFTWAMEPEIVKKSCKRLGKPVVDEYGTKYTGKQFLNMIESNCPILYTNSIGQDFS